MKTLLLLLCLVSPSLMAQEAKVTSLFTKNLTDFPGREAEMIRSSILQDHRTRSTGTMRMPSCTYWRESIVMGRICIAIILLVRSCHHDPPPTKVESSGGPSH